MRNTKIAAILNITPNSFSDGGKFKQSKVAIEKYFEFKEQGADMIDLGGQSTSYGAVIIPAAEEINRLKPIVEAVKEHSLTSIDSFNYDTLSYCYDQGVRIFNDVTSSRDNNIIKLVASDPKVIYIVMYSVAIPADRNIRAKNYDEIIKFGHSKIRELQELGVKKEQIVFDPGIGFSSGPALSLEIISNPERLYELNVPLYFGHSRKTFFDNLTSLPPAERDLETLAVSAKLWQKVDYLRVHNLEMHKRFFTIFKELAS